MTWYVVPECTWCPDTYHLNHAYGPGYETKAEATKAATKLPMKKFDIQEMKYDTADVC